MKIVKEIEQIRERIKFQKIEENNRKYKKYESRKNWITCKEHNKKILKCKISGKNTVSYEDNWKLESRRK